MVFISDTNLHEMEINEIEVIEDVIFNVLDVDFTKYEGTQTLAGTNGVVFPAGFVIKLSASKIQLTQGAVFVK